MGDVEIWVLKAEAASQLDVQQKESRGGLSAANLILTVMRINDETKTRDTNLLEF